jgi:apolipoprotein N-acyltransferase
VVQTNNATYGYSGESRQQLAMGRLRAVEHGRTVLVAATSGISAVIAPTGRLSTPPGLHPPRDGHEVPTRDGLTRPPGSGAAPELRPVRAGLLGLVVPLARRRRTA